MEEIEKVGRKGREKNYQVGDFLERGGDLTRLDLSEVLELGRGCLKKGGI